MACTASVRVTVSGLYCSTMMRVTAPVVGSRSDDTPLQHARRSREAAHRPAPVPPRAPVDARYSERGDARPERGRRRPRPCVEIGAACRGDRAARRPHTPETVCTQRARQLGLHCGPEVGGGADAIHRPFHDQPFDVDVHDHCTTSSATGAGSGTDEAGMAAAVHRSSASLTERPCLRYSRRIASITSGIVTTPPCAAAPKVASIAMLWMLPPASEPRASHPVSSSSVGDPGAEGVPPDPLALGRAGKRELDHEAQAAQERGVERRLHVRREDRQPAVRLHALQQVVDLDVGVAVVAVLDLAALAEQRVGLVEEQDRAAVLGGVEQPAEVLLGLADVLADHRRQVDPVEVEVELGAR